jgi:hypothetical protein
MGFASGERRRGQVVAARTGALLFTQVVGARPTRVNQGRTAILLPDDSSIDGAC